MRKSLTYKILAAVMAVSAVNVFMPHNMLAYGITSDNTTISTGTINENIYGNGHSFTINGDAVINGNVYGAINENSTDDVSGGNVTISGNATINGNAEVTYAVYGGYSVGGEVYNNTVNISGGSVDAVFGGYSHSGNTNNNTVNISGGSVGAVFGGYSGSGEVHHNTVNISGDTVTGNVHGGWSNIGEAYDNTVNISNGTVRGYVFGGYIYYSGSVYDNEVIISGSADITNANLYGRNDKASGTGNTLTIDGWKGNNGKGDCTVKSLNNFDSVNFDNLINLAQTTNFTVTDTVNNVGDVNINSIAQVIIEAARQKILHLL